MFILLPSHSVVPLGPADGLRSSRPPSDQLTCQGGQGLGPIPKRLQGRDGPFGGGGGEALRLLHSYGPRVGLFAGGRVLSGGFPHVAVVGGYVQ